MSGVVLRKSVAAVTAATLMLIPPSASAEWPYFRLKSPTGQSVTDDTPPHPPTQSQIFYAVSGPNTGIVGQPFEASSMVTGATGHISYSILFGSLPPGIDLNPSTGSIKGTPIAPGNYNAVLQANDSGTGTTADAAFGLSIATAQPAPPDAPSGSYVAAATAGTGYASSPLTVSGGLAPYTWSTASGTIPGGLTLDPSSGALAGMPNVTGSFAFAVRVTDALGQTSASSPQSITVVPGTLTATPAAQTVRVGGAVSGAFTTSFTSPVMSFGQTPAGTPLNLSSSMTGWSGTAPSTPGSYQLTWTARTADGVYSVAAPSVDVQAVGALALGSAPDRSTPKNSSVTWAGPIASNSIGTVSYALQQAGSAVDIASVCPGLSLDVAADIISGTPTAVCSLPSLQIVAADAGDGSRVTSNSFSLLVSAPLTVAAVTPAAGYVGEPYSQLVATVSGGTGSGYASNTQYQSGTSLITLWLKSTIVGNNVVLVPLTGSVPTAAGTWTGTISVGDSANNLATTSPVSVTINPGLAISGTIPSSAVKDTPYTFTPSVSGGSGGNVFSLATTSGSLTALGLTIDSSNGKISGTPTTGGSWTGAVKVTNAAGASATTATATITVPSPLSMSGAPAAAVVGSPYSWIPTVSGGTSPYSFTLVTDGNAQSLASMGLSFSSSTGAISGTPSAGGVWSGSMSVKDAASGTVTLSAVSLTVANNTAPTVSGSIVTPWTTAAAIPGTTYTASGGVQPYTWSLSGNVPSGLTINASTGALSGTPKATGSFTFSVNAKGANNLAGSLSQTLVVSTSSGNLVVTSGLDNLTFLRWPGFDWGSAINSTAYNASGAVTWSMSGNPSWLSINSSTGVWQGSAPAGTYGQWPITVTGKDASNHTASYSLNIWVSHRTDVEGIQTSLYVNGVLQGTSSAAATKSVTSTAPLAVGSVIELITSQNMTTGRVNITGSSIAPSSATYEMSFGNGSTYTNCPQPMIMNSNSVAQTPNCAGASADHWRLTVKAISGTFGSGFYLTPSGYYSPPY